MAENPLSRSQPEVGTDRAKGKFGKWGAFASFLMAASILTTSWLYFTSSLRDTAGALAYSLADLLYGPVWGASLVTAVLALREHMVERAPRRMNLALLITLLAAAAFLAVACIRAANRYYHLTHPELHLENSSTVLVVWNTLVAGVIGTAWHLLGWVWILIGSAGWSTLQLPRAMSVLYLAAGAVSLVVYILPEFEGGAILLTAILGVWQGIWLWRAEAGKSPAPENTASQAGEA
jgi:hypothetical protein